MHSFAGVCNACSARDAPGASRLAQLQQKFAKDLDPSLPGAPQTLGDMTERLKVGNQCCGSNCLAGCLKVSSSSVIYWALRVASCTGLAHAFREYN